MTAAIPKHAETIFHMLDHFDTLTQKTNMSHNKVGFSELYAYATQSDHVPTSALKEALSSNLNLRRDLKRLLNKQSIATMMRAAAASSGQIERREGDGFVITLRPSQADENQIYLLIHSEDRDDSPSLLFVEEENGPFHRLVIEDFYDGEAQILLSVQDDIVKALRKPKVDVILR